MTSKLTSLMHQLLVLTSQGRDDLAIDRANYLTAWQLSLDLNLPGVERAEWAEIAEAAKRRLFQELVKPSFEFQTVLWMGHKYQLETLGMHILQCVPRTMLLLQNLEGRPCLRVMRDEVFPV